MKSKELQIGDWVCAAGPVIDGEERETPPMRVVAIGETWVHLLSDPKAGDPDEYDIEDIRPIPLTEEILIHSGFRRMSDISYSYGDGGEDGADATVYNDDECGFCATLRHEISVVLTPVAYVHQLQHALRLAGVDMSIVLHSDN